MGGKRIKKIGQKNIKYVFRILHLLNADFITIKFYIIIYRIIFDYI